MTITLPSLEATALDSVLVQLNGSAATLDADAKGAVLLYGSPTHASGLVLPAAFPVQ